MNLSSNAIAVSKLMDYSIHLGYFYVLNYSFPFAEFPG